MIHLHAWWLYCLLGLFATFGAMVAGLWRFGRISQLEDEKRDLARQLATAVNHPSMRPGRVLRVVGGDGAASRPGRF